MIDVCDVIHHEPTGEDWVVAAVDGDKLYWCGYPFGGFANLEDCKLVSKASDEQREKLLNKLAEMTCHVRPVIMAKTRLTPVAADTAQPVGVQVSGLTSDGDVLPPCR